MYTSLMMIERGSIEFIVIHVNQEEIIEQLRIREKLLQRRGLLIVKGYSCFYCNKYK